MMKHQIGILQSQKEKLCILTGQSQKLLTVSTDRKLKLSGSLAHALRITPYNTRLFHDWVNEENINFQLMQPGKRKGKKRIPSSQHRVQTKNLFVYATVRNKLRQHSMQTNRRQSFMASQLILGLCQWHWQMQPQHELQLQKLQSASYIVHHIRRSKDGHNRSGIRGNLSSSCIHCNMCW